MSLLACDPEEQHSPDFAESPLTLICEGLLGEDLPQFRHEINLALQAQDSYLTDIERQMFHGGKKSGRW